MSLYKDYLDQIEARKKDDLNPKPIEDAPLVSELIAQIKDLSHEHRAQSLDFFIYTFTKTTVWAEYHEIKQDVLLKIADIIRTHGAEIAFPTRTVELIQPEPES